MKKVIGITILLIGVLLEAILILSLLNTPYDTTKGRSNLLGQILFDVTLGLVGIILILWGIRMSKK